jgi:hypothetical protein
MSALSWCGARSSQQSWNAFRRHVHFTLVVSCAPLDERSQQTPSRCTMSFYILRAESMQCTAKLQQYCIRKESRYSERVVGLKALAVAWEEDGGERRTLQQIRHAGGRNIQQGSFAGFASRTYMRHCRYLQGVLVFTFPHFVYPFGAKLRMHPASDASSDRNLHRA